MGLGLAPARPAALAALAAWSLVFSLAASAARGVVIASDNFESYPAGSQLESGANGSPGTGQNGGTGWTGPYNIDDARKTNATVAATSDLGGATAARSPPAPAACCSAAVAPGAWDADPRPYPPCPPPVGADAFCRSYAAR